MKHRKKRGYYSFISTLFFPKDSQGQFFNINQNWLPLATNKTQHELLKKYKKDSSVFPVLSEKSHTAIAASLELYALDNNVGTQSNLIRFRPNVLDTYEEDGENASITNLLTRIRDRSLHDRVIVESHNQAEAMHVLEDLLVIIENALDAEGITLSASELSAKTRYKVPMLLGKYPFLAFVIFDALPELSILYVSGFINDVKCVYAFIRPKPNEIEIDEEWISNEHIVRVFADD